MKLRKLGFLVILLVWIGNARGGERQYLYGNLHSHTGLSDGVGTVEEAIKFARDVAKLDFLAITDHDYLLTPEKYQTITDAAAKYSTDKFLVIPGFEWTSADFGHVVVLNSKHLTTAKETPTFDGLVSFARKEGAILILAHPALLGRPDRIFGSVDGNDVAIGIEIGGAYDLGSSGYTYRRYDQDVITALERGWHLGVGIGQDNHHGEWGVAPTDPQTGKTGRIGWTGVVVDSRVPAEVMAAIKGGHTFATETRDLRLSLKANGKMMGDVLPNGRKLTFAIDAEHPKLAGAQIGLFEDNYEAPVALFDSAGPSFSKTLQYESDSKAHRYFVRVLFADGSAAWTSPIFVKGRHDVRALAVSPSPEMPSAGKPIAIEVKMLNAADAKEKVAYHLYNTTTSELIGAGVEEIPPGSVKKVSVPFNVPYQDVDLRLALVNVPEDDPVDNTVVAHVPVCTSSDPVAATITVTRDFGKTAVSTWPVTAPPCATAADALKTVATIEYAAGLLYGINGLGSPASNTAGKLYWCWASNGKKAGEGIGTYRVKAGDQLSFDLHSWADESPTATTCLEHS